VDLCASADGWLATYYPAVLGGLLSYDAGRGGRRNQTDQTKSRQFGAVSSRFLIPQKGKIKRTLLSGRRLAPAGPCKAARSNPADLAYALSALAPPGPLFHHQTCLISNRMRPGGMEPHTRACAYAQGEGGGNRPRVGARAASPAWGSYRLPSDSPSCLLRNR
jgi:hypothetical protein